MFKIFRKRTNSISEKIIECKKLGAKKLCIDLWVKDQILFQVGPIEHMLKHGLVSNSYDDMVLIHFFNKNKTHTLSAWDFFKANFDELGFIHFEEPKGVHFYIKNIGNNPDKIEKEILANIEHYAEVDNNAIQIEYKEY